MDWETWMGGIQADLNPQLDANGNRWAIMLLRSWETGLTNDWFIKNKSLWRPETGKAWTAAGCSAEEHSACSLPWTIPTNTAPTRTWRTTSMASMMRQTTNRTIFVTLLTTSIIITWDSEQCSTSPSFPRTATTSISSRTSSTSWLPADIPGVMAWAPSRTWSEAQSITTAVELHITVSLPASTPSLAMPLTGASGMRMPTVICLTVVDTSSTMLLESGVYALSTGNDISREWTQLDEHILSWCKWQAPLQVWQLWTRLAGGAYGEYRSREYQTRNFIYNWNVSDNNMPSDFRHSDIPTLLSSEANMGYDKLYLLEEKQMRNNYRGHNTLGAGYLALSLPLANSASTPVSASSIMIWNSSPIPVTTRKSESSRHYKTDDVFPSLNTTYKSTTSTRCDCRMAAVLTAQEFREVSSSVYYDFDLASNVQGNTELKNCYVDNLDLIWVVSIPWRAHFAGSLLQALRFSYRVDLYGGWWHRLDLLLQECKECQQLGCGAGYQKESRFIGLKDFSWSFNGALIKSKVQFEKGAKEDRPMQGQSPYLINTGIFYKNEPLKMDIAPALQTA